MQNYARGVSPTLLLMVSFAVAAGRDAVYITRDPDSIAMPLNDETTLTCEVNVPPDNFTWRHYPLSDTSKPSEPVNLGTAKYIEIPHSNYTHEKVTSVLRVNFNDERWAGDYQCLAHYGASVVASVPGRITLATLAPFPEQNDTIVAVTTGNTVTWSCVAPFSNPEAYVDYYKDGRYLPPVYNLQGVMMPLILPNVTESDSGVYRCQVGNIIRRQMSVVKLDLKVVNSVSRHAPTFINTPRKQYIIRKGATAFLECSAIGNPVPHVNWHKRNAKLPEKRIEILRGGLKITNVTSSDDGVYVCTYTNTFGTISHHITLMYIEAPTIEEPRYTDAGEGEELDLKCEVKGIPEPIISWVLNGNSVLNDTSIEAIGNNLYFRPVGKRHAGTLQCFASNVVKTVYKTFNLKVYPKQISSADSNIPDNHFRRGHNNHKERKRKGGKHKKRKEGSAQMVPPNKPTVTRLSDESVVVRWSVPANDGLPIQFFKVQYRELDAVDPDNKDKGARWKTTNPDIAPHIRSFEVDNLKPNHYYKFRIAAVFSNNDNKNSPHSDKFLLSRQDFFVRNPLPVPILTHTEALNSTAVRIYWNYTPSLNASVDGFFVNYISASSAGDYMRETVDGEDVRSYVIGHLLSDTVYDVKLQSFNSKSASEFSSIMKQKTLKDISSTEVPEVNESPKQQRPSEGLNFYVIIAIVVVAVVLLVVVVVLSVVCHKWKKKKSADKRATDRDKAAVDEVSHHIQADANDYIVNPKSLTRSNGCLPQNRMNITANPLADADNKNQNMIEMSCLSNNNCSAATQPSVSTRTEADSLPKSKGKSKRNNKLNADNNRGENYV